MKRFLISGLLILICASTGAAQSRSQKKRIGQIAVQIAGAYEAKNLGRLDQARLIRGPVRIVIGSFAFDETDETPDTVRRFRSFKSFDQWLKNRQAKAIDNPGRYVRKFAGCRKGRCEFNDDGGSLHNQLYLDEILYGYRNGRLFIKAIRLWNGD